MCAKLLQLCPTPWDPMDCSQPCSSVHGIFHQEYWSVLTHPPSGDSSWHREWAHISCIFYTAEGFFTAEPPGKPKHVWSVKYCYYRYLTDLILFLCFTKVNWFFMVLTINYAGQETTVRTGHGMTDWFQIGKGVHQGCILSPCLFNFSAEYIMWNAWLDEAQAGIKIAGRNTNNLRYVDDTTLMAESEEELKSFLMKVKEESEKVSLKLSIQNTKSIASCPISSWQIDGETMEPVRGFLFLGSKSLQMVTATMKLKNACSLKVKLWLT